MKEDLELFSEMSLSRLRRLRNTWISQIALAEQQGWLDSAHRMRSKLAKVDHQLQARQNENLNDLFS